MSSNIYGKLVNLQNELKAPKGQYNSFGKYKYRSQEDILEAVKPLLQKHGLVLFIKDEIQQIGERYYLKATATVVDIDTKETIETSALARESIDKKGMDDSQITGTASSYARKYCLNGLFLIDDTKDADTDAFKEQTDKKPAPTNSYQANQPSYPTTGGKKASDKQINFMKGLIKQYSTKINTTEDTTKNEVLGKMNVATLEDLDVGQAKQLIEFFQKKINA